MILYLLKSTFCLGIFLLVYLLLLEKEKMHRFNRWYLLGSIVFALIVPLVNFTIEADSLPVLQSLQQPYYEIFQFKINSTTSAASIAQQSNVTQWPQILLIVYCIVSFGLLVRFYRNIHLLFLRITENKVVPYQSAKLVLLQEAVVSHTFLNHIFVSEDAFTQKTIEPEVLIHELTHVKQKHSLDILFVEFLQSIFWFNPLFILYKKTIQLNHEFLADDAVLKQCVSIPAYQYLLLDKISLGNNSLLSSSFNFSVTKKRLVMMTRTTNQTRSFVKKLFLIPLLVSVIAIFSSKSVAQNPPVITPQEKEIASTKEGVSQQLLDELNAIVQKNMTKTKNGHDILGTVNESEADRLLTIYQQMSKTQQAKSKIAFEKRIVHKPSGAPSEALFESFKDPVKFGVWVNGKKVTNDVLNKYKASDFGDYRSSNLYYTEKMKKDVMKTFNLTSMYEKQVLLTTKEEAEARLKIDIASAKRSPYIMVYRYGNRTLRYIDLD